MELGLDSSSLNCPLGLSLAKQQQTTSTITSANSSFEVHQPSDSIDSDHLNSLSLDDATDINGGDDGDRTEERENNEEENVEEKPEIEIVSKNEVSENEFNSRGSSNRFQNEIDAAENGGEDGDRTEERANNEEEIGEEKQEFEVSEKELSCRSSSDEFHNEIGAADSNVGEGGGRTVERDNSDDNGEQKEEIEKESNNEGSEKVLSCKTSNWFHTEVNVDGEDGDRTVEIENNEENTAEKREIENVSQNEGIEKEWSRRRSGHRFPVRPEAEDCTYYLRTGTCKFGMNCKFNHPPNHRRFQGGKAKAKEECVDYAMQKVREKDESLGNGQIDCKYFDRPGGCKFGTACKFNHSRKTNPTLKLNFMGLPIRLGEKECPFYMRNGSCKFGANCRFNHPAPTSVGGPDPLSEYSNAGSVFSPDASQSTLAPWSPTALNKSPPYVPLMFSPTQGVAAQPEWNAYQTPVYPPERSMHLPPTYAMNSQSLERPEQVLGDEFPERPGQPECSYFLRNGNCKYKSACKFHHPKSALAQSPSCLLSDLGLPLRPGESVCSYYSRYGICKYGPACKYDHPNHAPLSDFTVSAANQTPVLGNSMVNNQAMAAES